MFHSLIKFLTTERHTEMIKIKTIYTIVIVSIFSFSSISVFASAKNRKICGTVNPILSVADVNANGIVDQDDIKLIKSARKNEQYIALYDFDTNGKIDDKDISIAKSQLGQNSEKIDQQLALLYNRHKQFQLISNAAELRAIGYDGIPFSFAGHGEHWVDLVSPLEGDYLRPEGLNVPQAHNQVSGLFWGINATPVFENGATDYPTPGGEWETQRVISFSEPAPNFFNSPDELWHKHGALCFTIDDGANGPIINADQFVTYAQCKVKPSSIKDPVTGENIWVNIYMLHAWIFDLNPNGVFANTHPCIDPNALQESTINGNREVPPFFLH